MFRSHNLAFVAFLLAAASPAFCQGFLSSGGSARSMATAGTYMPSDGNVLDAMALNPAGLALIDAAQLDLSLFGGLATGRYTNGQNPSGNLSSIGGLPYGASGTPLGKGPLGRRLTIGVAALPELLSDARWNYTDPPGGVGSVSYGRLHNISSISAVRTAVGIGVYLGPRVQLGATFGSTWNTNELDTAYVFQNYQPLAGLKTLLTLHTSGYGWNGTAGALVRISRQLEVGASYHSKTVIQSTGEAAGNAGVQFAAIGLGAANPVFRYNAEVDNVLPQSVAANAVWQANSRTQIAAQMDWINWGAAFRNLPVILSNGDNSDINGLLRTNAFSDSIPLEWRDQYVEHIAVSRKWGERGVIRGGYAHANTPVPGSTLSPLTAAIERHTISGGAGYSFGRWLLDGAWSIDPTGTEATGLSALKAGEFNNTRVRITTQAVVLTLALRL